MTVEANRPAIYSYIFSKSNTIYNFENTKGSWVAEEIFEAIQTTNSILRLTRHVQP